MDLLDEVTSTLEDRRAACVLTGVDYSKAFNRLAHGPCLQEFATKGAPTQMIQLLASFLKGRRMKVKVGKTWSNERHVNSGVPQESVLGSFLFNVGIDTIEHGCLYSDDPFQDTQESHPAPADYPACSTPTRVGTRYRHVEESPIRTNPRSDQEIRLLPRAVNSPPWLRKPKEQSWRNRTPVDFKFIDDGVNASAINMKTVAMYEDHGQNVKLAHPVKAEAILGHISARATTRGMKVNGSKTSLMLVTAATSYRARAEIKDTEGTTIKSSKNAKYLGVTLDSDCTFSAHVENVKKRVRSRAWTLNALKQNGFTDEDLIRIYCTYVRPIAEYASVAWGTMISQEQSNMLEKQQSQALKNIYGLGISGQKMRERAGVDTLQERRKKALEKFAKKSLDNPRFSDWFKERPIPERNHRETRRKYEEPIVRTERYWNSPLNAMRRCLNVS